MSKVFKANIINPFKDKSLRSLDPDPSISYGGSFVSFIP